MLRLKISKPLDGKNDFTEQYRRGGGISVFHYGSLCAVMDIDLDTPQTVL